MTDYMADKGLRIFLNGWEVIPIIPGKKIPGIPRWASVEITETVVRGWAGNGFAGYGIGIRTGKVVMLDLDIPDQELGDEVEQLVITHLGQGCLIRYGNRPKRGLIYRTDVPFRKIQTPEYWDATGRKHQGEALGEGQQFVAEGDHADTGRPYEWEGFSPEDTATWELPCVTELQMRVVIAEIEALFIEHGLTLRDVKKSFMDENRVVDDDDIQGDAPLRDVTIDKLRRLVEQIPNDDVPYEDNSHNEIAWLQMLMSIAHQTGKSAEGEEIAREWSEKSSKHDDEEFDKTWGSLEKERNGRRPVTGRYVVKWAKVWEEKDAKRPEILIKAGYMHEIANEAEEALLAYEAPIYARASQLVRPVVEEVAASDNRKTKVARLTELGTWGLMDWLSRAAVWKRFDSRTKKPMRTDPPSATANIILSRDGEWRLRPLAGVITTPTIRPDGSLILTLGWDSATRLLLVQPPEMPPIPDKPSRQDARRALDLLLGLLHEFPFVNEESRSVALSMLMTPVLRGAIPNAPLHVARAPVAGTGKSYLVDVASAISTGRSCPVIAAGKTEDETEKRLGAILLSGQPIASIDNLNGELEGDLLCQIVERPRVQVRVLGRSETPTIETRVTLYANGNNLIVKGDMVRRTLVAELDTNLEQPELREFKDNPVDRVQADRGAYVAAVLIIAKAYLAAGCPDVGLDPLASFDSWSKLVRAPLVWLGCADPKLTQDRIREEDPEIQALQRIVRSWRDAIGVGFEHAATAVDLITTAVGMHEDETMTKFHDALLAIGGARGFGAASTINVVAVGRWLGQRKGRIVDGLKIMAMKDRKSEAFKWFLHDTSST